MVHFTFINNCWMELRENTSHVFIITTLHITYLAYLWLYDSGFEFGCYRGYARRKGKAGEVKLSTFRGFGFWGVEPLKEQAENPMQSDACGSGDCCRHDFFPRDGSKTTGRMKLNSNPRVPEGLKYFIEKCRVSILLKYLHRKM